MKRLLTGLATVVLLTAAAFAGTSAQNANSLSTTLQVQATVQTAITFSLATDSCVQYPGSTTDYQITLGSVDGLGLGSGVGPTGCTPTKLQVTGATPGYLYALPYTYTVHFSGFNGTAPKPQLAAYHTAPNGGANESAVQVWEGATETTGGMSHMPTTAGTATTIGSSLATGATGTRYLGLFVAEYNGAAALPGSTSSSAATSSTYSATVTFVVAPD